MVSLGEICDFQNGRSFKKTDWKAEGLPIIRIQNLNNLNAPFNYFQGDYEQKIEVNNGDLLFSWSGTIGSSFGAHVWDREKGVLNQHIFKVTLREGVEKWYAYHALQWITAEVEGQVNGAVGLVHITKTKLKEFEVPLPSLPKQKRIVAILDEAFEGIDRAVANAEKNLANARELFESYLNNVFTQKGDGWVEKKLGDIDLTQIIDGDRGTNYPKKADFLSEGFCLFLNTKNVRPDGFNFDSTMFITEEKDKALRKGKLKRRDVLLTTRGTIGNIALYDDSVDFDEIRINSGMLIFRPNENLIVSEYLFEILRSGIVKSKIERYVSGAAQPQLPIKTLVNFTIPVPTNLDDQKNIVSRLRNWSVETNHLQSIYQRKLTALAELKQSVLQKAFSGELTADISTQNEAVA
jgi:restriction endonuclease S subunit